MVFGGIHATLYPDEARELGGAHAVVKGDGDVVWPLVLDDAVRGTLQPVYEGGRVDADRFVPRAGTCCRRDATCGARCRPCAAVRSTVRSARSGAPTGRSRGSVASTASSSEIVELRRRGFRFVALADDNFYPVTLADLAMAERQRNKARLEQLQALRAERFELMAGWRSCRRTWCSSRRSRWRPPRTRRSSMRCGGRTSRARSSASRRSRPEGLKDVYKGFNEVGEALVQRLRTFRDHGVHVLGSFIFGLPSDRPSTFEATADVAERAGLAFAQFVMLTPYPGTVDFEAWEKSLGGDATRGGRHPGHAPLADPAGAAIEP